MTTKKQFFDDEFQGAPLKRAVNYILRQRDQKKPIVGVYCTYAPVELIYAAGAIPATLCAFANGPIAKAEETLPANMCPLIKSSYGFIELGTCPFFELTNAVIGETTCDGKKKMFELIKTKRPMFVMDLPQSAIGQKSLNYWRESIVELKSFLETTFNTKITEQALNDAIKENDEKNHLMMQIFDFAACTPSVVSWSELYDVACMGAVCKGQDIKDKLQEIIEIIKERIQNEQFIANAKTPRVLVTGSPLGGDTFKIYRTIEEEGGIVVGMDSCTARKAFVPKFDKSESDPYMAMAKRYLEIPCACMKDNTKRFNELDHLIQTHKVDAVVDVVLQACHTYNVESALVEKHVTEKHQIPFIKIVTDYSQEDIGQLKTRIGALIEMIH